MARLYLGDSVRVKYGFGLVLLGSMGDEPGGFIGPDGKRFRTLPYLPRFDNRRGEVINIVRDDPGGPMYELDSSDGWVFYGWQLELIEEETT